eukprot:contig_10331_g2482
MSPPSQTPSARGPSRRRRAFNRLTNETAVLLDNVRRFFEGERVAGRAYSLSNPVARTARATGVSERSVLRVRDDDFFESLAVTGDRETRARGSRTSPAEQACVRDAVYKQYENRSLPTVDSTVEYLTTAATVHAATGIGSLSTTSWTRTSLFRAMRDSGFHFARGLNHYDVARENPAIKAQRENYIDTVREYRRAGRTVYYTDETWVNNNMSVYRSCNDATLKSILYVPSGKGGRIIIAHVGSCDTGLLDGAGLVFIGKSNTGDYQNEMNSRRWLEWLQEDVFPKISGQVLVVDRAPYHLVRTPESRPATSKMRKADWLEAHNAVPDSWEGPWRTKKTKVEPMAQAANNRPAPRFLVQDQAQDFGVSILISPVAHPQLNPIEIVWGTVKMAAKRGNTNFTLTALKELVAAQLAKITPEKWLKHELHAIKMEGSCRRLGEISDQVAAAFDDEQPEVEGSGGDGEGEDAEDGVGEEVEEDEGGDEAEEDESTTEGESAESVSDESEAGALRSRSLQPQ